MNAVLSLDVPLSRRRPLWRYGFAVGAVAASALLRWFLGDAFYDPLPFITFYPTVALVALLAGGGPAALATGLSALIVTTWIDFGPGAFPDGIIIGLFLATGALLSVIAEMLYRSQADAIARLEDRMSAATAGARQSRESIEAREALRTSEARFRMVFEHALSGIYLADAHSNRYVDVNPAGCALLRMTRNEVLARTFTDLIVPSEHERLRLIVPVIAGGDVHRGQWTFVRLDGSTFIGELAGSRLPNGQFLGIVEDVTERVLAEAEKRDVAELQQRTARQKDDFLAILAHELRNPLAPIRSAVGVLSQRETDDPAVTKCHVIIERQATQMARLLDDLLDVSRLSRGRLVLQCQPIDLRTVIEHAVDTARPLVDDRRHELRVDPGDQAAMVDGDPARLVQVIGNLLTNAAKYTMPHGTISVALRRDGIHWNLSVSDNGMGIDPVNHGRIFELFVQSDGIEQNRSDGLGIGLALARQLVELHRGRIVVESPGPGGGSVFRVLLPMALVGTPMRGVAAGPVGFTTDTDHAHGDEDARDNHGTAGDQRTSGKSCAENAAERQRVLIVDDNGDAADAMALLLDSYGCEVRIAYDGDAGIRMAEEFRPTLILLDVGLPGLDGLAVCRQVRRQPWGVRAKICAVTGWGRSEDKRRTSEAGFDVHLVKPVATEAILDLLRD